MHMSATSTSQKMAAYVPRSTRPVVQTSRCKAGTTADHPQFCFRRIGYKSGICSEYTMNTSSMDYDGVLSRLRPRKARVAFLGNHGITLGAPHA